MSLNKVPVTDIEVGDEIQVEAWPSPVTVLGIKMIFHMSNNMDLVVTNDEEIWQIQH